MLAYHESKFTNSLISKAIEHDKILGHPSTFTNDETIEKAKEMILDR